jgi:hypothetical protein
VLPSHPTGCAESGQAVAQHEGFLAQVVFAPDEKARLILRQANSVRIDELSIETVCAFFDFRTGELMMGDYSLRTYPIRAGEDGRIMLTLTPEPAAQAEAKLPRYPGGVSTPRYHRHPEDRPSRPVPQALRSIFHGQGKIRSDHSFRLVAGIVNVVRHARKSVARHVQIVAGGRDGINTPGRWVTRNGITRSSATGSSF